MHPTQILGTISGLLVGKQTVPAAEAFAFKELLGRSHGPVTFVVDAKYVINKWQKIRNRTLFTRVVTLKFGPKLLTIKTGKFP